VCPCPIESNCMKSNEMQWHWTKLLIPDSNCFKLIILVSVCLNLLCVCDPHNSQRQSFNILFSVTLKVVFMFPLYPFYFLQQTNHYYRLFFKWEYNNHFNCIFFRNFPFYKLYNENLKLVSLNVILPVIITNITAESAKQLSKLQCTISCLITYIFARISIAVIVQFLVTNKPIPFNKTWTGKRSRLLKNSWFSRH